MKLFDLLVRFVLGACGGGGGGGGGGSEVWIVRAGAEGKFERGPLGGATIGIAWEKYCCLPERLEGV